MKKGRITIAIVLLCLVVVPFNLLIISGTSVPTNEFPNYIPVDWKSGLAGDVKMPEFDPGMTYEPTSIPESTGESGALRTASTSDVGTWVWDWYLSAISDGAYPYMQLRAVVGNVEVWVGQDEQLMFADGDERNDNPLDWNVTFAMAQHMAEEFDSNIYPGVTGTFGAPFDRDGTGNVFQYQPGWPSWTHDWIPTDNSQRVILKIFNIHDESYDNPDYPYYVVGFFSSGYTRYYNRNMIHIDNWRYWERLGEEGHQWYEDSNPGLEVTRPHVYESTVAHEFQHNVHSDWQPDGELWMNEGCSMLSEYLSGYEYPYSYLPYFLATPDNSLIEWGDQGDDNILADYAQVLLWTTYIMDHYGTQVLTDYVQDGIPGIDGINAALLKNLYSETMDDIFHDWRIANLIHSDCPGEGRYNYITIDLGEFYEGDFIDPIPKINEIHGSRIPWTYGSDLGGTKIYDWYETDIVNVGTYGTDYILLDNVKKLNMIFFDGDAEATFPHWVKVDGMWYSGKGDLMDSLITTDVFVDPGDPTLYLTTYWDIEDYWDYGFIQVFNETSGLWESLANEFTNDTFDPSAHDDIIANMPGLTSWSVFYDETDPYDGVIPMMFDLSDYADQTVQIGFRYMTDWAFTYEGWYILGASVGSQDIMDTLELVDWIPDVEWMVTVIEKTTWKHRGKTYTKYRVEDMYMRDTTHGIDLTYIGHKEDLILVVSPLMAKGTADYRFKTIKFVPRRWH